MISKDYGSKKKCARTDTVLFPISHVCTRGVTQYAKTNLNHPLILLTKRNLYSSGFSYEKQIFSHNYYHEEEMRTEFWITPVKSGFNTFRLFLGKPEYVQS